MVAKHTKLSDIVGASISEPEGVLTVRNQVIDVVEKFPANIALVCFSETEDVLGGLDLSQQNGHSTAHTNGVTHKKSPYLRMTFAQLFTAAQRFATSLHARGFRQGDAVCTVMYTGAEVIIVAWAAFLLGAVWVPLHPRTAANEKELKHVLEIAMPKVFVALDGEVAANLEESVIVNKALVRVVSTAGSRKGWVPWSELMSDNTPLLDIKRDVAKPREDELTLIVFTSGTTSMPKGCGHTNRTLGQAGAKGAPLFGWSDTTKLLTFFPFHHIGGCFPAMAGWAVGAEVVIPSPTFSAEKGVKVMRAESVTDIGLLPSMMLAMQEYDPTPYNHGLDKLTVILSATTILREHYLSAKQYFNFTHFSGPYGSSEGVPATGTVYDAATFNPAPGPINPGKPAYGVRIKVCAQGSRDPIPRNEIGELHQGGCQVIPGYLKKEVDEFYTDEEGTHWFSSGDAAVMDDYDNTEIIGRVKDMIIRGGVNISPARIEDVVNTLPGVEIFVVAATDVISGEVPVAVVRYIEGEKTATPIEIREAVLNELGPTFALSEVIQLEELGLSDWPKTTSGKVRKVELRASVKKHLDETSASVQPAEQQSLHETLAGIWSRVLGLPASKLSPDTDLRDLADSLTTMQFRAQLRKTMGKSLSTQQLLYTYTIAAQAKVLEESQNLTGKRQLSVPKRDGPPEVDDVSFVDGDVDRFENIKQVVSKQLSAMKFDWKTDVEDLIPLWDWGQLEGRRYRPKSMIHRHAFVSDNLSRASLRKAFEKTMNYHPLLRSFGTQEGKGDDRFMVILRSSETFFNAAIYDAGTVDKASHLATLCFNDIQGNTFFPGLLFKIIVADIRETGTGGFVFISQHATFDAGSMSLFFENFGLILNGSQPIERTNYKAWADMYYSNRTSAIATQAVRARAKKLEGVSSHKKALWPPSKAPGFYFGDDTDWVDPETHQPGDPSLRPTAEPDQNFSTGLEERGLKSPYDQGVTRAFELPKLFNLQQTHGIHPVTLVQNSLVLANMYMTRQPAALLTLANGGRTWPFIQPEVAELLPEPVEVDGPMVELIPHAIYLPHDRQITVIDFLREQQQDQQSISKHAHAPFLRVQEELGPQDGPMMEQILRHQVFNWLPIIGQGGIPLKGFTAVQKTHHNDFRVTWAAGMPTAETLVIHADVDRAQLTVKEVQRAQEILRQAALWMCEEQNWGRNVADFLDLDLDL